jgi:hypothetical protein
MSIFETVAEQRIQSALEEGVFDNLPGQGQPIRWPEESADPAWTLAHRLLRDNGFSLPWIEELNALDEALAALRARIARAWDRYRALRASLPELARRDWLRERAEFARQAAELNRRITSFNISVPLVRFQRPPLDAEHELARLTGGEPGGGEPGGT